MKKPKSCDTLSIYNNLIKIGASEQEAQVYTRIVEKQVDQLEVKMLEKIDEGFNRIHKDVSNNRWTTILSTLAIVASIVFAVVHLG